MQKWFEWIGELSAKGRYVGGDPLLKEGKLVQGKKPVATDGPFAEGKELLGDISSSRPSRWRKPQNLPLASPILIYRDL